METKTRSASLPTINRRVSRRHLLIKRKAYKPYPYYIYDGMTIKLILIATIAILAVIISLPEILIQSIYETVRDG